MRTEGFILQFEFDQYGPVHVHCAKRKDLLVLGVL